MFVTYLTVIPPVEWLLLGAVLEEEATVSCVLLVMLCRLRCDERVRT